jgi:hypothetical protein
VNIPQKCQELIVSSKVAPGEHSSKCGTKEEEEIAVFLGTPSLSLSFTGTKQTKLNK